MNEIAKRNLGSTALSLPDDLADRLLAGIEESQATTLVAGGGKDLIKLSKNDGTWNIGQSDEPMQVGSKWWINIVSICHGFICWSNYQGTRKNERLGEVMVPMYEPKPPKPGAIEGFPFAEQRSFEAVCLNGEDEGKEVQFKNGSVGTMKGFKKLEDAVKAQLKNDRKFPCPVIQFKSEKYKHSDYGWIHNPVFEVVGWANLAGELKSDKQPGPAPVNGSTKTARTKPALVEADEPEVTTAPAAEPPRPAQRRRPPVA